MRPARWLVPRIVVVTVVGLGTWLAPGPLVAADPPGAGGMTVSYVDPSGEPVTGACAELWSATSAGARGTLVPGALACDAEQVIDASGKDPAPIDGLADGTIGFAGLAPGPYLLAERRPAQAPAGPYAATADQPLSIALGDLTRLTVTVMKSQSVAVTTVDGAGDLLPGACFSLGDGIATEVMCDGRGGPSLGPGDGRADGIVVLGRPEIHKVGPQPLRQTHPPSGYAAIPKMTVSLAAQGSAVTVTNDHGTGSGGLLIRLRDASGIALPEACWALWTPLAGGKRGTPVVGAAACDSADPPLVGFEKVIHDGLADGTVGLASLTPGSYVLGPTRPGVDARGTYALVPDQVVTIKAGALVRLDLTSLRTAALTVTKVDPAGAPLVGACFMFGDGGPEQAPTICDGTGPNGDGQPDGIVVLPAPLGGRPGTYRLRETRAPVGYAIAPDRQATVAAQGSGVTVTNDHGTGSGGLLVRLRDASGIALPEACWALWTATPGGGRGTAVIGASGCDSAGPPDRGFDKVAHDGLADGSLGLADLAPGRFILAATRPAEDARGTYAPAPDQPVTIKAGALLRVDLTTPRTRTLTVTKVDPAGAPLVGACFMLGEDARIVSVTVCDGPGRTGDGVADGIVVLDVPPGSKLGPHRLRETRAPVGYAIAPDRQATVAAEGSAVTVTDDHGTVVLVGGPAGALVPALELEIDSTINVRTFSGLPVTAGKASVHGRIRLAGDLTSGSWQGNGDLVATTGSGQAGGCPSIDLRGDGSYDWQVRQVMASPGIAAERIAVDMDSGPVAESPDSFVMDACTEPIEGTLNLWENLFFTIHRGDYGSMGLHVDRWSLVGDAATWTTGGVLAEATWSGSCSDKRIVDCDEATTFRLHVLMVPGSGSDGGAPVIEGPSPTPPAGVIPDASSPPGASAGTSGLPRDVPIAAQACADIVSCFGAPTLIAGIAAVVLALAGGTVLVRARFGAREVLDVPGSRIDYDQVDIAKIVSPDLNAAGNDTAIAEVDIDVDKHDPITRGTFEGVEPLDPGDIKLGDFKLGTGDAPIEPLDPGDIKLGTGDAPIEPFERPPRP